MTTPQTPVYRSHTTPPTNKVEYRQPQDEEDGVFEVRMPIATTGQVRNEGDDPLTRDELSGMATQIENRSVGVFLDHGGTSLGGMERYSAVEKVGEWRDAEVESTQDDDGPSELVATARLMDPESLPSGVSELRAALGSIKEQVKRDFSVSASIGWREDDAYPGGNDLMEASIVGIGADPRTTSSSADESVGVVARAAVEAGADPEALLEEVRDAVGSEGSESDAMTDSDTPDNDGGTTDEEQSESETSEEEFRESMREQMETQTEILRTLADALRQEDDEDDEEDEEDEEENEADEDDDDEEDDDEESQSAEDSEMEERIAELEDTLEAVRSGDEDVETPNVDEEQNATDGDQDGEPTSDNDWRQHAN